MFFEALGLDFQGTTSCIQGEGGREGGSVCKVKRELGKLLCIGLATLFLSCSFV